MNLANPTVMTYGPGFPGSTALVNLANPATILQQWGTGFFPMYDYGAPDPTGGYVVLGVNGLTGAELQLMNATTGGLIGAISTQKDAAMPNW